MMAAAILVVAALALGTAMALYRAWRHFIESIPKCNADFDIVDP
jgi:hypothetical protein